MDEVAPEPGDIIIDKLHWDAFHYTELDPVLRNLGTRRLIVAGLQTNVCVETTARAAMMRNFEVAVPEDAVSTDGTALHAAALDAMRVLYIEVAPWRELIAPGRHGTARSPRRTTDVRTHPASDTWSPFPMWRPASTPKSSSHLLQAPRANTGRAKAGLRSRSHAAQGNSPLL
jgi:Isochorismatase family